MAKNRENIKADTDGLAEEPPIIEMEGEEGDDEVTGATPGVASACKEFGMENSHEFAKSLGIKPPGQV